MKIITIIAALAALPLTAQEQAPEQQPAQPVQCSCPRQQQSEDSPQCPQAAMAAAFGFQRGYHMGFEAGFAEAIHIAQKASECGKPCGHPGKKCKQGKPERPEPAPDMRPMPRQPQPAPQADPRPAPVAAPAPAEQQPAL